jgi:putative spermidine/putrescine transport system permease protein
MDRTPAALAVLARRFDLGAGERTATADDPASDRLESNLEDASAALGANAWRTFRRITLPLSLPGIIAGSLLTFSATITAFITQSLVGGGQMLFMPMYIYQQASALQNWPYAAAISLVFLVAVIGCVTLLSYLGRLSKGYATT